ncbi:hypothetical protein N0V90_010048 [Kalmusia sp. IMI 367209]|nr:hypothetical protein N0V90_010048 [Kalmusia sp. IMI 367209]
MDPLSALGLVVNIVQVIDGVTKIVGYINDVKDAPKDRARLARECTSLLDYLVDFRYKVEESSANDPWYSSARLLAGPDGPLIEFEKELEELKTRLKPQKGPKKIGKSLIWTVDMRYINKFIQRVERLKTFMSLARQQDQFTLSLEIKKDVRELRHHTISEQIDREKLKREQDLERNARERQDMITWISGDDHSIKQRDFLSRCEDGTGEWFLNHIVFKKWLDGKKGTLWSPGGPGVGKTIITSLVVDTIERLYVQHDAIAYIYFNYKEQAEKTTAVILANLFQQLLRKDAIISVEVASILHPHMQHLTRPSAAEWSVLLKHQISRFSRVFIVVDALDECSENTRDEFLAELRQLQPSVNLMITSRPTLVIESELPGAARLDIQANDRDIRRYLKGRIEKERRLRRLLTSDLALQGSVVETIVQNSRGMFLLAQLQMDAVAKKNNRRDVRNVLTTLPRELHYTYDDAMRRIWSQGEEDVALATRVLYWTSYALRPLTLLMLQHAIAIEPGDIFFDDAGIPDEEIMISVCAGLVTVDQESQTIRLVHYTTQEYFESIRVTRFPHAQISVTRSCLAYLCFQDFATPCKTNEEIEERLNRYPFLAYAAQYWGEHARGEPEEKVKDLALALFRSHSKLCAVVQIMHYFTGPIQGSQETPRMVTGMHVAASFGLSTLVVSLLECDEVDVNLKDSLGRTALMLAVENGHASVVLQLVERDDVDINVRDLEDRTPLLHAVENGYTTAVEYLLRHPNIDVNAKDKYHGQTALWIAADKGYDAIVQLLLGRDELDANSKDDAYGHTPLWQAVERGQEEVVRLLLEQERVDVNARDKHYGRTPLYEAADRGNAAIVQLLLYRQDLDIGFTERYNRNTPLEQAYERGHASVVHLFSAPGAAP